MQRLSDCGAVAAYVAEHSVFGPDPEPDSESPAT